MKKGKRAVSIALASFAIVASFFFVAQTILANTLQSSVTVGNAPPVVSSVVLNGASTITLTANTTTPISVSAVVSDNNGCGDLTGGTTTIVLYRTTQGATCAANNLNCYTASAFTASSTCAGGQTSINTTTTFNVQYFAQATDASSSFTTDSWKATVNFTDPPGATSSVSSPTTTLNTLLAINITTSSINYGAQAASSTTGATNQMTTTTNAGNASTSLNLSGTEFFSGANKFATTSQHYATSSFTFGTGDTALTDVAASVSGFLLTSPTTTANVVSSTVFWGLTIPGGTPTGTYTATTTFTAVFHS